MSSSTDTTRSKRATASRVTRRFLVGAWLAVAMFAVAVSHASAEPITFSFEGAMTVNDADFSVGDRFSGTFTFESTTTAVPAPDPTVTLQYPAMIGYKITFLTKGYILEGTFGNFSVGNDTAFGDRYIVTMDGTASVGVPLPSGRSLNFMQFDIRDSNAAGADLLADDSLPTTPPDLTLADVADGRVVFSNNDQPRLALNTLQLKSVQRITEIIDNTGDGTGNTLADPVDIAVDLGGNVYVSGLSTQNAFKITPGGVVTQIIDTTGDGAGNALSFPEGIAADADGNVYVAGAGSGNAFKITPAGVITKIIDGTGDGVGNTIQAPEGIAVDAGGNVYIAGMSSSNAFKITPAGGITEIIDATGDGAGNTLSLPIGIAVDAGGNVYVAGFNSSNAFKITPVGIITQIIDASGDGAGNALSFPNSIAADADGNVYVSGQSSNNAFKITPAGVITQIIDATGDGAGNTFSGAGGIAVDASGNVYVAGFNSSNAFKITPAGVITQIIDTTGDGAGNTIDGSISIVVDVGGNVYITGRFSNNAFKISFECGDGFVNIGEECDDSNTTDGDGCSATCTIEPGFACTGEPSVCIFSCGNGNLDPGEQCDDANVTDGDGCSATCTIEPGFSCTGQPSVCILDCNGNGIADATDIANATSQDCNGNGIPDECEIDANSVAPGGPFFCMANCDPDCNIDGIPDECQLPLNDCNSNMIPDDCDIAGGASQDCNTDAIPDECQLSGNDCNADTIPDDCQLVGNDCDANSVPDECETDCNINAVPDVCDISSGTSQDCNVNSIPDSCDIVSGTSSDCNSNGVPDACDISSGTSQDCNGNEVPDECEISIGSTVPGGPFFCMANCDPDCNANGLPDACDIADCLLGDVTCDDCNLNGVPDACDISAMTSADANSDGVPDECVASTAGGGTMNWSDGGNWPLGGTDFPDNDPANTNGVTDLSVTIDVGSIFLDTSVEVNSTRVLSNGMLSITQTGAGDLAIAGAGGLSTTGTLEVANDRTITVGGMFTVGDGGRYEAAVGAGGAGCAGGTVCASLSAGSARVEPGDCTAFTFGGSLVLTEGMALTTTGGLTVAGSAAPGCTGPLGSVADTQGITPPPKFVVRDLATMLVSGSLVMSGAVGSFVDSTQPIILLGDFDNDMRFPGLESSSFPRRFDWSQASVRMEGTQPQRFEVAGLDFGPTPGGFLTDADTLFETVTHTNFSIGALTVADGSAARFVNDRINSAGAGPCEEALYVGNLELEGTATIILDNVRVFYNDFVGDPAAVQTIGCGALRGVCKAAPASAETILDGGGVTVASVKDRFLSFSGGDPGLSQAVRVTFVSLPGAFSVFNGTVAWVDVPVAASELPGKGLTDPVGSDPTFLAAKLTVSPIFADWSTFGVVHVYDERIIPSRRLPGQSLEPAVYDVQLVTEGCDVNVEVSFSPPLTISNARWGDLAQLAAGEFRAPDGVVAIDDTLALLAKFAGGAGAPITVRADLVGTDAFGPAPTVDGRITVSDLLAVLQAFAGAEYPFPPPTP